MHPIKQEIMRKLRFRAFEVLLSDGLFIFTSIVSVIFHTLLILVIFFSVWLIDFVAKLLGLSNTFVITALTYLSEIAAIIVFIFAIAVFLKRAIWLYHQISIEVYDDEDSIQDI